MIYSGINSRERKDRAMAALKMVDLENRMKHRPFQLSGGQQQRVAIARALVNEPAIILADEPTGNLDSKSGVEIMQVLQNLNREKGITIILVTHDPWIARHCQRVIRLADGLIVGDEIIENPLIAGEAERPSDVLLIE
jgi:putative ABC transport system ATP-binding protein